MPSPRLKMLTPDRRLTYSWLAALLLAVFAGLGGATQNAYGQAEKLAAYVLKLDKNDDGQLGETEIPAQLKRYLQRVTADARLGSGPPYPLGQLVRAIRGRANSATTRTSRQRAGNASNEQDDRVLKWANALIKKYDLDQNGSLAGSEISAIPGGGRVYDRNRDGRVTHQEIAARLARATASADRDQEIRKRNERIQQPTERNPLPGDYVAPATSQLEGPKAPGATETSANNRVAIRPRSHAVSADSHRQAGLDPGLAPGTAPSLSDASPAKDAALRSTKAAVVRVRPDLPEGLPAWFEQKDADYDGQVMMHEYAATWPKEVLASFRRYDLNGDGIITPRECLKVMSVAEESNRASAP